VDKDLLKEAKHQLSRKTDSEHPRNGRNSG
ncbi:hypothetical protein GWI33_009472, partial [Rhynchophorus ferrugineus]